MRSRPFRIPLLLGSTTAILLSATPSFAQTDPSDPWERMNRRFFAIEGVLDRHIFGPLARSFGKAPSPIRAALRNISQNLSEPLVAVNDLLQGRIGTAASTVGRFTINSTFGVAGIMDIAKKGGIPHHDNSFGTTLGRWGAAPGPYIFLPLVGPTTFRDGFGSLADIGLNPFTYVQYSGKTAVGVTTTVVDGLNERVDAQRDLETIQATSTDPYATLRSYYLQNRQAEVTGQSEIGPLPELDESPLSNATTPPPAEPAPQPDASAPPAPTPETAPETTPPQPQP